MYYNKKSLINLLPFLLVAIIIFLRDPIPLLRAEFWAEDGTEFFLTSLTHGIRSLYTPVMGYHLFISRLIAYIATFFPILWIPYIYSAFALIINSITIGYFTRNGFSWIVESKMHRIFIVMILAVGPGTKDVFLNISNIMHNIGFLTILILVEEPHDFTWKKFFIIVIFLFSAGQLFVFFPLVLLFWYFTKDRRYFAMAVFFIFVAAINLLGNVADKASAGLMDFDNIIMVPRVLIENFIIRLIFVPLGGSYITTKIIKSPDLIFWSITLISFSLLVILFIKKRVYKQKEFLIFLVTYTCIIGIFGVVAIVRNYASHRLVHESGTIHWGIRYSFLSGMVTIIGWTAIFFRYINNKSIKNILAISMILLIAFHNLYKWNSINKRNDLSWPESAQKIQSALDMQKNGNMTKSITIKGIQVHPKGWLPEGMLITIKPDSIEHSRKIY